jgi:NADH:ubiquinone reductase (H+-translocating)
VIIGGGFAGIAAVKALRHSEADVTVIDRRNHHIFQPLLYQVATAVLAPADVAAPIRQLSARQKTCPCCWLKSSVSTWHPELSR